MTNWATAAKGSVPVASGVPVNVPRLPTGVIDRPRLVALLETNAPLTVIHGPAGFGKTTLAVQWVERNATAAGRTVWMSLQNRGYSAAALWEKLAEELRFAGFELADGEPALTVPLALRESGERTVIVVDGFDLDVSGVDERPLVDLVRTNRNLQMIVTLRQDPPFLKTPITDIDICKIDPEDLQFTAAESDEILSRLAQNSTVQERQFVHQQLGGWPQLVRAAGVDNLDLQRVNLLLQVERPKPFDSAAVSNFLFRTAILERFTEAQARVLSEDSAVQQRITALVNVGVLRQQHDGTFSYVPAVRKAVMSRVDAEDAAQMRAAYVRMAEWKLAQRAPVDAMQHAFDGKAWALLVHIIERHWNEALASKHATELMAQLPDEAIESEASLRILRDVLTAQPSLGNTAWTAEVTPDEWLRGASAPATNSQLIRSAGGGNGTQSLAQFLNARAGQAVILRVQGNTAASAKLVETLHAAVAAADPTEIGAVIQFLPALYLQWGLTELLNSDLIAAATSLTRGYGLACDQQVPGLMRNSAGAIALVFALNGDPANSELWLQREAEVPREGPAVQGVADTPGLLARALRFIDQWELDAAREVLSQTNSATEKDELWAFVAYAHALLGLVEGGSMEEIQRLTAAQIAHPSRFQPDSSAGALIRSVTANLLMAQGKASHAAAQLRGGPLQHELLKAPRARLELLRNDPTAALRELVGGEGNVGFERSYGEQQLLAAVAHLRAGSERIAVSIFTDIASYLLASGVLFPFRLIHPAELGVLLELTGVQAEPLRRFVDLESVFPSTASVVTLSEREHIVLSHLAEGMTLSEIADFLVVSPNTVKSQTRSVYKKLGVSSRDAAVTMAHELGMLTAAQ